MQHLTLLVNGNPAARPVVLLPGLFAGAWIWLRTADRMAAADLNDVVIVNEAFALAECMGSASVGPVTDAVMQSLAAEIPESAILCGNSFGGLVALDAAIRYPDRVMGIIVSGAPGLTPEPQFGLGRRVDREFAHRAVARLFHDPTRIPSEQVDKTFEILVKTRHLRNVIKGLKAARNYDTRGSLNQLTCPTLFIWGQFDEISPVDAWIKAVDDLPNASLKIVPDSGHSPMLESPELFADLIVKFFRLMTQTPLTRNIFSLLNES